MSNYFYLKSHEILTIFRSKETLTILCRVLFIEKATRMMKLKYTQRTGNGKGSSLSLLSEEVFITGMMSDE